MENEILFDIHHSNRSFPIKFESRKILQVQRVAAITYIFAVNTDYTKYNYSGRE
jgi:hypothetical protein